MVKITVQVVPRSSKISIAIAADNSYKIKLTSPAVEGAANEQLIQLLSRRLSIPKRDIEIASGEHGRRKIISIRGLEEVTVRRLLMEESK